MSLIPKRFELAGIPVTVELVAGFTEKNGHMAQTHYTGQKIFIDKNSSPVEITEQTFFHELVHWILFIQNKHELRDDEDFVDAFSQLLYQAIKTGGYKLEEKSSDG